MQDDEHGSKQGELKRWCRRLKLTVASGHVDEIAAVSGDKGTKKRKGHWVGSEF